MAPKIKKSKEGKEKSTSTPSKSPLNTIEDIMKLGKEAIGLTCNLLNLLVKGLSTKEMAENILPRQQALENPEVLNDGSLNPDQNLQRNQEIIINNNNMDDIDPEVDSSIVSTTPVKKKVTKGSRKLKTLMKRKSSFDPRKFSKDIKKFISSEMRQVTILNQAANQRIKMADVFYRMMKLWMVLVRPAPWVQIKMMKRPHKLVVS